MSDPSGGSPSARGASSSTSLSTASKLAAMRVAKAKARNRGEGATGTGGGAGSESAAHAGASSHPDARRFHIAFHLRPADKQPASVVSSASFKRMVHDEYLARYLESLGVNPSRQTMEQARAALPQEELRVTAAWKNDMVTVSPLDRLAVVAAAKARNQAAAKARRAARAKAAEAAKEREAATAISAGGGATAEAVAASASSQEVSEGGGASVARSGAHTPAPPAAAPAVVPTRVPPRRPSRVPALPAEALSSRRGVPSPHSLDAALHRAPPRSSTFADKVAALSRFWAAGDRARQGGTAAHSAAGEEHSMDHQAEGGSASTKPSNSAKDEEQKECLQVLAAHAGATQLKEALAAVAATSSSSSSSATTTAAASSASTVAATSLSGSGSSTVRPLRPPPLLQMFSLGHIMSAHSFPTRMQQEHRTRHSRMAVTNVSAANPVPTSQQQQEQQQQQQHLLYWVPAPMEEAGAATVALMGEAHTGGGGGGGGGGVDPYAPASLSIVVGDDISTSPSSSPSSPSPTPSPSPRPSSFMLHNFSASSPSFPALCHLFHNPPVVDPSPSSEGGVGELVRAFMHMVPLYESWMGSQWWKVARALANQAGEEDALYEGERDRRRRRGGMGGTTGGGGGAKEWTPGVEGGFATKGQLVRSVGSAAARAQACMPEADQPVEEYYYSSSSSSPPPAPVLPPPPARLSVLYPSGRFVHLLSMARARFVPSSSSSSSSSSGNLGDLIALCVHYLYHTVFRTQLAWMRRFRTEEQAAWVRAHLGEGGSHSPASSSLSPPLPVLPPVLSPSSLSELSLQIQSLYLDEVEALQGLPRSTSFFRPLLRDVLASVVLALVHRLYPLWFGSAWGRGTDEQLLRELERVLEAQPTAATAAAAAAAALESSSDDWSHSTVVAPLVSPPLAGVGDFDSGLGDAGADNDDGGSLFFRTSALVRAAVPLEAACEGARLVRKGESAARVVGIQHAALKSQLSPRAASARTIGSKWSEYEHAHESKTSSSSTHLLPSHGQQQLPLSPRTNRAALVAAHTGSTEARIGGAATSRNGSNPFSIAARLAKLPPLQQGGGGQGGVPHAPNSPQRGRGRPTTSGSLTARVRSPLASARSVTTDAPAAAGAMSFSATIPHSPRQSLQVPLYQLGLRKVAQRHARDNVFARDLIAQMPGGAVH